MWSENRSCQGVIVVPFVIAMLTIVTLLGMLTEASLVLHARHKLADGAETALLSAANLYNTGSYTQTQLNDLVKSTYSSNNFMVGANTSLNFGQITSGILALTTSKTVTTFFLRTSLSLTSTVAVTIPQPVSSTTGMAPLAMLVGDFAVGTSSTSKQGANNPGDAGYSPGNFGALALGGSGASTYENNFTNGYSGTIAVGANLNVQTGNMAGGTRDAAAAHLANDPVVLVVLTNSFPTGSSGTISVVGVAAFKITSYGTGSHSGEVTGTFIKYKIAATGSSTQTAYGLYTKPKLLYY